jgi:two-component system phosphate regulon sensor histidine kinase PhoR
MSLGMIGIISIQYFWIKNALDLRKVQFNRAVLSAMTEVTHKLQKEHAFKRFERIKSLNSQVKIDSLGNLHVAYSDISDQLLYINSNDSDLLSSNEDMDLKMQFSENEIENQSPNQEIVQQQFYKNEEDSLKVQLKIITEKLDEKYILYEQLLKDLNEFEYFSSVEERIDGQLLKEELKTAFDSRGLNFEFAFGVVSYENEEKSQFFETSNEETMVQLYKSPFKVSMFPGDSFDHNYYLSVVFPNLRTNIFQSLGLLLSVSTIFILLIIGVFIATIKTIFRQKKLSEIKNDFISNMTHELKTPISTISLACEALEDKSIDISEERHDAFIGMIRSENNRLGVLVEKVLRNATLDTGNLKFKKERINLNELLEELNQFDLHIRKLGGKLHKSYSAKDPIILADRVHLLNVISNLVDNAIKYSDGPPVIHIETRVNEKWATIEVLDQGIGINKDYLQKIFDKFFRVPTGNVHNVKGFGLGLSYVWDVVSRSGGNIKVESELNKGSKFTINIPLYHE